MLFRSLVGIILALLPVQLACPGTSGQLDVPIAQCDVFVQLGDHLLPIWSGLTDTLDLEETE